MLWLGLSSTHISPLDVQKDCIMLYCLHEGEQYFKLKSADKLHVHIILMLVEMGVLLFICFRNSQVICMLLDLKAWCICDEMIV